MILKLKRTPGIYLVGFRAAGKSTIGRLLAYELGLSFADVDEDMVGAEGSSIAEIFDARGEQEFREIEREAIQKRVSEVERGRPMVVALGGGAFAQESNRELLEENGISIWLDCPYPTVCRRIEDSSHRPLPRDPQKFKKLFKDRRALYSKAEYRVEINSDHPAEVDDAILKLPIFQ